jgi:hypothetical protein
MPTAVVTENSTGGTHTGILDTHIPETAPTANLSTNTAVEVVSWAVGDRAAAIFRITPPTLTGATITSATLDLYLFDYFGAASGVDAYRVLRDVSISQVTWNNYATGTPWTTAGGYGAADSGATVLGTASIPLTTGAYYSIGGTGLTQYVSDQIAASSDILLIVRYSPDTSYGNQSYIFRSSNGTDGQRPKLTIDYTTGPPPALFAPRRRITVRRRFVS